MGYAIYILDRNKPITEDVMDELVPNSPDKLRGYFGGGRQPWGWSLACDISIRRPGGHPLLIIGGAFGLSGKYAIPMARWWRNQLKKKGFSPEVISDDFNLGTPRAAQILRWAVWGMNRMNDITPQDIRDLLQERLHINVKVKVNTVITSTIVITLDGEVVHEESTSMDFLQHLMSDLAKVNRVH